MEACVRYRTMLCGSEQAHRGATAQPSANDCIFNPLAWLERGSQLASAKQLGVGLVRRAPWPCQLSRGLRCVHCCKTFATALPREFFRLEGAVHDHRKLGTGLLVHRQSLQRRWHAGAGAGLSSRRRPVRHARRPPADWRTFLPEEMVEGKDQVVRGSHGRAAL